jgi:hypothetical protein
MYGRPNGEDVARLHGGDDRHVQRTAVGLEEVAPSTEPNDYDDAKPAPRKVRTAAHNRAQRRAMFKWIKSKQGKAALAKAKREAKKGE